MKGVIFRLHFIVIMHFTDSGCHFIGHVHQQMPYPTPLGGGQADTAATTADLLSQVNTSDLAPQDHKTLQHLHTRVHQTRPPPPSRVVRHPTGVVSASTSGGGPVLQWKQFLSNSGSN